MIECKYTALGKCLGKEWKGGSLRTCILILYSCVCEKFPEVRWEQQHYVASTVHELFY